MSNAPIVISVHDINLTLYPSDFTVPNGPLKTFVRTFLIVGIVILLIQQFHYLIITVTTFDVHGLVRSFDRQYTFFM